MIKMITCLLSVVFDLIELYNRVDEDTFYMPLRILCKTGGKLLFLRDVRCCQNQMTEKY